MYVKGYRVDMALLGAVVALVLLAGTLRLTQLVTVERPLAQALAKHPDILTSTISSDGDKTVISVELVSVRDLQTTYLSIHGELERVMDRRGFVVVVRDRRTPFLDELYHQFHLYLYEALATGNFGELPRYLEELSARTGVSHRLSVNDRHVFVQLHSGEDYLYQVIRRPGRDS